MNRMDIGARLMCDKCCQSLLLVDIACFIWIVGRVRVQVVECFRVVDSIGAYFYVLRDVII